jgi:hypothetical protein
VFLHAIDVLRNIQMKTGDSWDEISQSTRTSRPTQTEIPKKNPYTDRDDESTDRDDDYLVRPTLVLTSSISGSIKPSGPGSG